jgi:hypothetical protein
VVVGVSGGLVVLVVLVEAGATVVIVVSTCVVNVVAPASGGRAGELSPQLTMRQSASAIAAMQIFLIRPTYAQLRTTATATLNP